MAFSRVIEMSSVLVGRKMTKKKGVASAVVRLHIADISARRVREGMTDSVARFCSSSIPIRPRPTNVCEVDEDAKVSQVSASKVEDKGELWRRTCAGLW